MFKTLLNISHFCKNRVLSITESNLKPLLLNQFKFLNTMSNDNSCDNKKQENADTSSICDLYLVACGSFNPITNMHLRMFELAKDYLREHQPNFSVQLGIISPVSDAYGKAELANGLHRKVMCQQAVSSSSWIKVMTWELEQSDWTPTADVLDHFETYVKRTFSPESKVMLLCGADVLQSFSIKDLWLERDIRRIVQKHGLVVITRPSCNPYEFINNSALLSELQGSIHIVSELFTNDISSTVIRKTIRQKKSIKYLVPDTVADYIAKHSLYAEVSTNTMGELAPFKKHRSKK